MAISRARRAGRVVAAIALVAATAACERPPGPPVRPNVLLISIDTLRADRVNAQGYTARKLTPHMDALARDSVLFERHVTASPWTTPAHMSMFTSLDPSRHGVTPSFGELTRRLEPRRLHRLAVLAPERLTLAEALAARGYQTVAFAGAPTVAPQLGFGQGFGEFELSQQKLNDRSLHRVRQWLASRDPGRPFFLFWHTFEVHAPYLRTTFLREVLSAAPAEALGSAIAAYGSEPGRRTTRRLEEILHAHRAYTRAVCDALYDGGVAWMDDHLGQMIAWLKEAGLYDGMLIVVTSDHGEELGDRGVDEARRGRGIYNSHGHTLYEELVHVPLIVKLPGQAAAGRRVREVTRTIDVMPTVLDLAGAMPVRHEMQGATLRPLWGGGEARAERLALTEALSGKDERKAIRSSRFKYIVSIAEEDVSRLGRGTIPPRPAATELYDLSADPRERHDLLADPRTPHGPLALRLDRALRSMTGGAPGATRSTVPLDRETMEDLEALGYLQ
jgi:arylsulfatase